MDAAVEVRRLSKTYPAPPVMANDDISFTVGRGEVFGLLGANGAGKSTLVRQVVGLLRPSSGEVAVLGAAVTPGSADPARHIAYLPQGALALGELKVAEAVTWTGMLRGLDGGRARAEAAGLVDALELGGLEDRPVRKLSGGQRRLTHIAMTLVGPRPVVVLDEPTADVDPALRLRIWDLLSERARSGAAVVLVTHDVREAERALDRVAILRRGRLVAHGTPALLKAELSHRMRIELVVRDQERVADVSADLGPGALGRGRRVSAWVPADEAVRRLDKVVGAAGPDAFEDIRLVTPTLEDVYLEVSGRSLAEDEGGQ